jgi:hypothetical protein
MSLINPDDFPPDVAEAIADMLLNSERGDLAEVRVNDCGDHHCVTVTYPDFELSRMVEKDLMS